MELIHKMIPPNILYSLPKGIKFINRHGKEFLVIEELTCPKGHSLLSESVKIHGEPSVRLHMKIGDKEGLVFIDSYWGSHSKLFSFIPNIDKEEVIADVTCPECGVSLVVDEKCHQTDCHSEKAIVFHLPGDKNKIYVCARLGCPDHRIEIVDIPHMYVEKISEINYFDNQEEENLFEGI
ncbi:MAG: hypothetical protein MJB14_14715 [Spirochaetes bacterium]|nr:hypothetical protein [Spirochaetota bacterium]